MVSLLNDAAVNEHGRRMKRIRDFSRWMATGCLITSALLGSAMLLYWIATPSPLLLQHAGLATAAAAEITLPVRLIACAISMLPLGALIYGLLSARRCFLSFAAGDIFSSESVNRLKAFALAVAVSALLKPLAGAALSVVLSVSAGGGTRTLALSIGSDTLLSLIFAGTVAVIAWTMAEAINIADENKQFV